MKTRNPMKPKMLMPLLLVLISAPVLASDSAQGAVGGVFSGLFGPAIAQVAQFSAEERRVMRERWEQASPEERLQMRREFKERSRQIPSDSRRDDAERDYQRDYQRDSQRDYPRDAQSHKQRQRGKYADEASFGFGFERRRYEDDRIENPPPGNVPAPFEFFDRRDYRDKNRDGRRNDDRR